MQGGWPDDQWTYAIIDGKQRIGAILGFIDNDFSVPGEWFEVGAVEVYYRDLPVEKQRRFGNKPLQFCEGTLGTIEEEQEIFELINFGGVPQGESDL